MNAVLAQFDHAPFGETGEEPRKAVERLLEMDGLLGRLPASVDLRDARGVRDAIVAWLNERQKVWTEALWTW